MTSIPTKRQVTDLERAAQEVEADMDFWTRNADPQDVLRRCVARIRALAPAQPEGWVSVPKKVTDDMLIAGANAISIEEGVAVPRFIYARKCYDAMLAASPPSPAPPRDETKDTDGQSGLSTSPSNEGDAGRPGQTDSSVPRDTLPEPLRPTGQVFSSDPNAGRYVDQRDYNALRQHAARLQAELEEARRTIEQLGGGK